MTRTVFCQYLQKEAPGLPMQFYPGEIGKRIFENISAEAWAIWLKKQTMLVNEHHYNLMNLEHRKILEQAMVDFLFNGKDVTVKGYVAPEEEKEPTPSEGKFKSL
ncbi:oxidative damage protection protein [Psittacicella gerlachiana]|uniref:Probable Fe(2+)-trafficking protein n=1 Tax=Psittacicella gerlachiana TaxID=2028574 RepID=A0A3A1Y5J4_9GAMM|nr:oxidative damage protection protein [Psittacicella gerlachiana]RIY31457.1 oxidative damage protection protein [Psittacicella gerlachiana]